MDPQLTFSFFVAAVLLAFMPGPDNIFVLTESITKGQRNGIALSCGLSSGVMVHTLAVATGVSFILQSSALAFQVVKYLGAAYLFYLAVMAMKEKKQVVTFEASEGGQFNFWKLYRQGFLMNVLNPKVSLFFIALLPQFVTEGGITVSVQLVILGGIFMLTALVIFSLIAILSGRLSSYLNNDRFWIWTKYGKVAVLALLGTMLLFTKK
ncbi:MAG: threonine/homoserine/homoserine lactone efflux protein [Polaribacter sp.]|jgi:threonine/homoserine/homoserine lactone efflux protein